MDVISSEIQIIIAVVAGFIASYFAHKRGRRPLVWFVVGILIGLLAVLLLFLLPNKQVDISAEEEIKKPVTRLHLKEPLPQRWDEQEWYYLDLEDRQQGPIVFDELKKSLEPDSYIWTEGWREWHRSGDYEEICGVVK